MFKRVHKVIQVVVILPVLLCAFLNGKAQIYFDNPSFESDTTGSLPPPKWHVYEIISATLPDRIFDYLDYLKAYNGLTYIGIGGWNLLDTIIEQGFYQTLPCLLLKNVNYSFAFYATGFQDLQDIRNCSKGGGLSIWLADAKLNKVQLIYRICELDTNRWTRIDVPFKPVQNLNTFIFETYQKCNNACGFRHYVGLDNLSPITFATKDYITATISDSVIDMYKPVNLSCKITEDSNINYTYTWSSSPPGFTSSEQNPVANPLQTTSYIVTAHYNCGMDISDTVKVRVNTTTLRFPNAFTPNNDGKDDKFGALCNAFGLVTAFNLQVYNRWGQVVFSTTNVKDRWDGTFNNKHMPQGTYIYHCTYTVNGKTYTIQGDVELVR